MYEKNILIKGHHATYMKLLAGKVHDDIPRGLFQRNLDVYLLAPIVGKLYGRQAEVDNEDKDSTSIHLETMYEEMSELEANYRLIMLLEDKENQDIETRIDAAFRYDSDSEKRKPYDIVFEKYMLGGIDVLYERLMQNVKETDDYVKNIFDFMEDFTKRYEKRFDFDTISKLCTQVRKE